MPKTNIFQNLRETYSLTLTNPDSVQFQTRNIPVLKICTPKNFITFETTQATFISLLKNYSTSTVQASLESKFLSYFLIRWKQESAKICLEMSKT